MQTLKILWLIIGIVTTSFHKSPAKLGNSFKDLYNVFVNYPKDFDYYRDYLMQAVVNLRMAESGRYENTVLLSSAAATFQVAARWWIKDLGKLKEEINSDLEKFSKSFILKAASEFIAFDESADDALKATPKGYSWTNLERLNWNHSDLQYMISNFRRISWIIKQRETGSAIKSNPNWEQPMIAMLQSIIQKLISNIKSDPDMEGKTDFDSAIKMLENFKSVIAEDVKVVESEVDEDWNDFEPLMTYFFEQTKTFFKNSRERVTAQWIQSAQDGSNYVQGMVELFTGIYLTTKIPYMSEELKPLTKQVQDEMVGVVLKCWDAFLKENKQKDLTHYQKYSESDDFTYFFGTVDQITGSTEEKEFFLERLYNRLLPYTGQITPKSKSINGIELFVSLAEKLNLLKDSNKQISEFTNSQVTILLIFCLSISEVSLEQFKSLLKDRLKNTPYIIYDTLGYLDEKKLQGLTLLNSYLAQSSLLAKNTNLVMIYVYLSAKYMSAFGSKVAGDQPSLGNFLKYLQTDSSKNDESEVRFYSGFLQLVILAENPEITECLEMNQFAANELEGIEKLIAQKEFLAITNCFQTSQSSPSETQNSSVETQSLVDNVDDPSKLDINLKLSDTHKHNTKIQVEIEFLGGSKYEVKAHTVGGNESRKYPNLIDELYKAKKICKPVGMTPEKCLSSKSRKVII